jgi:formate dehydrogenase subunit gamma
VIERYTMVERLMHWLAAVAYLYVLLTGLAFYSPHLYWLATVLGGGPTSRYWHPWVGLLFLGTLVWMWVAWRAEMGITATDRIWGANMEHYARNEDEELPPIEKYNLGQKYFFWAMLVAGAAMLVSGLVMWMPERVPVPLMRGIAILLHVSAALATVGGFIIHVYMGTAVVRGSFSAMVRGQVSHQWAKTHHRLWYYRMTGK